jgi:hypothetical protein
MYNVLVYVAGPITAETKNKITRNIKAGIRQGARFWQKWKIPAFVPHAQSGYFEEWDDDKHYIPVLAGDLEVISRCDAMFLLPGWEDSTGAQIEVAFANKRGIKVFESELALVDWVKKNFTNIPMSARMPDYEFYDE